MIWSNSITQPSVMEGNDSITIDRFQVQIIDNNNLNVIPFKQND